MANLICAKCGQPIEEENLVECPFCWEIYHKECWEETKNCLSCKKFNLDYARVEAEKEEEEQRLVLEKENVVQEEEQADTQEEEEEQPSKLKFNNTMSSNMVGDISKIVLILGVVSGVAILALMVYLKGFVGGVIGAVAGGIIIGVGYVSSVLVNGFAQLIDNSQKSTYYLSRLASNNEDDEKENDD